MVEIPRSEDREVVDTRSLSALTEAFTRLAIALESEQNLWFHCHC